MKSPAQGLSDDMLGPQDDHAVANHGLSGMLGQQDGHAAATNKLSDLLGQHDGQAAAHNGSAWESWLKEMFLSSKPCHQEDSCMNAVLVLGVMGIVIVAAFCFVSTYLKTHNVKSDSKFGRLVLMVPRGGTTFWPMSHLVFYEILGFFFPNCTGVIIAIGTVWELVEHKFGTTFDPVKLPGTETYVQWWYGSVTDVLVDSLAVYLGKWIRLSMNAYWSNIG